ncbi:glycoside hydrolase family 127 protein [Paenibacillus xanthanilyticus]|uniref:Glycoside hydrolase family 127 protein n=1 Tax=Paenibacillus xanthanilyticus TaxID=1783531 RepID=A0ABV8JWT4_9BACL
MIQTNLHASRPVSFKQVRIEDKYWSVYTRLVRDTVIPYQWDALNDRVEDAEPSYAIRNFRIAAGHEEGEFGGFVFQDSDLAKWLEAVGYSLAVHPDPELEAIADGAIDLIVEAQQPDGYLNTYFTIKAPEQRWTNLFDCHELYCAGHMIEAAVAYYEATGKRKLLDAMCRFADYIDAVFGPEPGKLRGYDGHQEIELALVKLYKTTGEEKYAKLAAFFINERGQEPNFLLAEWEKRGRTSHWQAGVTRKPDPAYNQAHKPVREQDVAVGHSVRAVYMYTAMADLAALTGDEQLLLACRKLWNNMVGRQMYITGGIGSTHHGEAFSFDYDLPNDTVYAETCASIGLIFFAHRMLQIEADAEYADVLERALYNNVAGSMQQDGKHFFYVNPLDVWPEASEKNPGRHHVKPVRQKWFGCACCPPNVSRLLSSLGEYIYTTDDQTIYTHLYIGSEAEAALPGGAAIKLKQETDYPWSGNVRLTVGIGEPRTFTLAMRIPSWADGFEVKVNGQPLQPGGEGLRKGYLYVTRTWGDGDALELALPMEARLIEANPSVRANAGKAAMTRGPLVYCLEETDNGSHLSAIAVKPDAKFEAVLEPDVLGGTVVLKGEGFRDAQADWSCELYRPVSRKAESVQLQWVPYSAWGNRGAGEMSVWFRMKE